MEVYNRYFDSEWFNRILQFKLDGKYQKVIQNYRLYIKKYPDDICAICGFTSFLMDLGLIDEAAEIIKNTVITETNVRESGAYWVYGSIKLLACQGRFEECYELFEKNKDILIQNREDYKFIEVYISKKLGLPLDENAEFYSYTTSQVVNYSDERAIEHIYKHKSMEESEISVFLPNFSIEENFYKIKKLILTEEYKKMFGGIFKNVYYFKYIGCGIDLNNNNNSVDYIKVITLQDTNEIITMFPCQNIECYPSIDITPVLENTSKVKKLSQIEKFNKKYGL